MCEHGLFLIELIPVRVGMFLVTWVNDRLFSCVSFFKGGAITIAIWNMVNLEEMYRETPIITRTYTTLALITTVACTLDIVNPLNLYLNTTLVVEKFQVVLIISSTLCGMPYAVRLSIRCCKVWRLLTNFLYFGNFGLDFFFHIFFLWAKLLNLNWMCFGIIINVCYSISLFMIVQSQIFSKPRRRMLPRTVSWLFLHAAIRCRNPHRKSFRWKSPSSKQNFLPCLLGCHHPVFHPDTLLGVISYFHDGLCLG